MKTITINIGNEELLQRVNWLLERLEGDGLEIIEREDLDDLKLILATRNDEVISFENYLLNED
jgi:hypothetical protein